MKFLIHTLPARLWYVTEYLIPSMMQQDIKFDDIDIYIDEALEGNLKSTLRSFKKLPDDYDYTWHLQDDIIISSNFKQIVDELDLPFYNMVSCGFCSIYDKGPAGEVTPEDMWYSFNCIKISNKYAHEFVRWVEEKERANDPKFFLQISNNMYDDYLFKSFLMDKHPDAAVDNIAPNLVENIDYLIGGSTLCKREEQIHSRYWKEDDLIEQIKNKLS